jgi:nucleotide-binding universal stress UspA family protein
MTPAQSTPSVVLVAVDFSEASADALLQALDYADARSDALHVMHVVDSVEKSVWPVAAATEEERLGTFVNAQLKAWGKTKQAQIPGVVTHVVAGNPAKEIVQLASELAAEIVVVGSHGRHGVARMLLGSVADRVVRLSPSPVLVVPQTSANQAPVPAIEPPCPRCLEARQASGGKTLWCEQHRERHGARHTFHYLDRNVEAHTANSLLIRV